MQVRAYKRYDKLLGSSEVVMTGVGGQWEVVGEEIEIFGDLLFPPLLSSYKSLISALSTGTVTHMSAAKTPKPTVSRILSVQLKPPAGVSWLIIYSCSCISLPTVFQDHKDLWITI